MKKKVIIIIICVIAIILLIALILYNNKNSNGLANNQFFSTNSIEVTEEDIKTIEEIKNEINATANTDMYEVQEEYDGRKIIQIKSNIQYDTVLAGILKNGIPKESEIQEILNNRPIKSGVWISKQSREKLLKILKENNINEYEINEEGYLLQKENKGNKKIDNAISSDKLYIIDISGKCYTRDELSGEIVEYPFEEMEPDQILELYSVENSSILEVTSNSRGYISSKEILQDILLNLE